MNKERILAVADAIEKSSVPYLGFDALANLIAHAPSDLAALLSAYDEQAAAEVERLRAALIRACNATGGYCGTDSVGASNGFLTLVGAEVEACIGKLRAQIAALTAAAEGARAGAIEEAARVCEAEWQTFLSPEYATGQPLSSFQERLACSACAAAIRALAAPATGDANG